MAEGAADIALKFCLGYPLRLEIELIENCVVGLGHDGGRTDGTTRPERHAQADDSTEAVRTQQRGMPGYGGAPVVAGDHGRLRTERVEQAHHVADEVQERVLV